LNKPSNAAQQLIGTFAPKLVELMDRVLFDDIWERKELSPRDRSLITVAALVAMNRPDQLRFHLGKAIENGVKEQELIGTETGGQETGGLNGTFPTLRDLRSPIAELRRSSASQNKKGRQKGTSAGRMIPNSSTGWLLRRWQPGDLSGLEQSQTLLDLLLARYDIHRR
jgi:4-carboxymuconolactone decarboxylase